MNITNSTFHLHNILSCKGFEESTKLGLSFGPCAMAKLGMVFIFFISAFVRKWLGEEMGLEYSFLWSNIVGLVSYFILITLFGNFLLAFLVGLGGMVVGGFFIGNIFGGGE